MADLKPVSTVPPAPAKPAPAPPTGPAREGVDQPAQVKQDAERAKAPAPAAVAVAAPAPALPPDPANIPNVVVSGTGGGGGPVSHPSAIKGAKMVVQMLVPYASAQTILYAGKAYTLSEEFARQLLETDPPSATTVISEMNRRALRPTVPDPEDKGHD